MPTVTAVVFWIIVVLNPTTGAIGGHVVVDPIAPYGDAMCGLAFAALRTTLAPEVELSECLGPYETTTTSAAVIAPRPQGVTPAPELTLPFRAHERKGRAR